MASAVANQPWYERAWARRACWAAIAVVMLVDGVVVIGFRGNDFTCHWSFGLDFRAGRPYRHEGNYYPLGRAMWDAALTAFPYRVSRALSFVAATVALWAACRIWRRLLTGPDPCDERVSAWLAPIVLVVVGPYVLRDFDECGLQTLLLFLLSAGAYAISRGRRVASGCCLAAAATYKATPLIFLPFLLWKREWKAAGAMAGATLLMNVALPACCLGWHGALVGNRQWWTRSQYIFTHMPEAYPSIPGAELPKQQNLGLKPLLARFVETYPPGHSLYLEHPGFVQFGDLSPAQAKALLHVVIGLLGLSIAWRFRSSWAAPGGSGRLPYEWAVASVFSALLSPLCWKQHLVLALPVVMLVAWRFLVSGRGERARRLGVFLAASAAVVWLSRHGIVGRETSVLLMSYKLDTVVILLATWLASPALPGLGLYHGDVAAHRGVSLDSAGSSRRRRMAA